MTLTANFRLNLEGKVWGPYLISGGGLYYRDAIVSSSSSTVSSTVSGGNIGIGFNVRILDSKYRFYVESRYHYAPTKGGYTQMIPFSAGIRF